MKYPILKGLHVAAFVSVAVLIAGCGGGDGPATSGSQVNVVPPSTEQPGEPSTPSESTARYGAVYSYRVNDGEQWLLNYHGSEGTATSAQSSALDACNGLENAQDCRVEFTYAIAPSQPSAPSEPSSPSQPETPSQPSAPSGSNVRYGAIYSYTVNDSAVYSYTLNAGEPVATTRIFSYHGNETNAALARSSALAACNALGNAQDCRVELVYWTAVAVPSWTGVRTGGDGDADGESTVRYGAVYSYRVNDGEQWLLSYHGSEGTAASARSSALAACNALENAQDCRVEFTYAIAPPASSPTAPSGGTVRYGAIYSYATNAGEPRVVSYHGNEDIAAEASSSALDACNALGNAQGCRVEVIYWTAVAVRSWTGVRTGGDGDADGDGEGDGNGNGDADGDGDGEGDGDSNIINSNFKEGFIIYGYSSDSYAKDGDEYANRWLEITYSGEAQTFAEARSKVRSRCASNTNPCYILANFSNCAALAESEDSLVKAYGTANSAEEARSDALAECSRLGGSGCGTASSICRLDQIGDRPPTTPIGGFQRGGFNVCNTVGRRLGSIDMYGALYRYDYGVRSSGHDYFPYQQSIDQGTGPLQSRTEARNAALSHCRSISGRSRCRILGTFTNCAVYVLGDDGEQTQEAEIFRTGDTLDSIRRSALAECRRTVPSEGLCWDAGSVCNEHGLPQCR